MENIDMKFIADFHIHSKYSRATSPNMVLENIDVAAGDKGILVMGTGDFTHPAWFGEIKNKLEPSKGEPGLFRLKKEFKKETINGRLAETRFILTVEISGIYSRAGKTRRIHNIIFAPDIKTVEDINTQLGLIGNLKSDGRPILGLDSEELAKIVFNINPDAAIVPAHIWTPWFSIFGSMSGFDSIEECFGRYADKIFAVEMGLSSDSAMNWRLSKLDKIGLLSNSDSHSLERIGREANIFNTDLSYAAIMKAIKSGLPEFVANIKFFPEEGRYHYDGHRVCGVYFTPEERKRHKDICPKCGGKLTIGVLSRVEDLADRKIKVESKGNFHQYNNRVPYYSLIQLQEIISKALGVGMLAKKVKQEYLKLIKAFGPELKILLEVDVKELASVADPRVVEAVKRVRAGQVQIRPGYDGEYGQIKIFDENEPAVKPPQASLF